MVNTTIVGYAEAAATTPDAVADVGAARSVLICVVDRAARTGARDEVTGNTPSRDFRP
jgi:hypothetical protein